MWFILYVAFVLARFQDIGDRVVGRGVEGDACCLTLGGYCDCEVFNNVVWWSLVGCVVGVDGEWNWVGGDVFCVIVVE